VRVNTLREFKVASFRFKVRKTRLCAALTTRWDHVERGKQRPYPMDKSFVSQSNALRSVKRRIVRLQSPLFAFGRGIIFTGMG